MYAAGCAKLAGADTVLTRSIGGALPDSNTCFFSTKCGSFCVREPTRVGWLKTYSTIFWGIRTLATFILKKYCFLVSPLGNLGRNTRHTSLRRPSVLCVNPFKFPNVQQPCDIYAPLLRFVAEGLVGSTSCRHLAVGLLWLPLWQKKYYTVDIFDPMLYHIHELPSGKLWSFIIHWPTKFRSCSAHPTEFGIFQRTLTRWSILWPRPLPNVSSV